MLQPLLGLAGKVMDIEVIQIQKSFKRKNVLRDISFNAGSGDMIGIAGVNGSGKSTLLSILANVQSASSGDFFIDGVSVFSDRRFHSENVGYVPQSTPLIDELSARDNLLFWYSRKELLNEIRGGIVSMLGVDEYINLKVKKMSGGMKKRLAICCAMADHPGLLLLDEPTAALDIIGRQIILDYISRFRADGGIVIIATHSPMELEQCSSIFVLKNGILMPYFGGGDASALIGALNNG